MAIWYELFSKTLEYNDNNPAPIGSVSVSFIHYYTNIRIQMVPQHPSLTHEVQIQGGNLYHKGVLFQTGDDRSTAVFVRTGTKFLYEKSGVVNPLTFDVVGGNASTIDKTNLLNILNNALSFETVGTNHIINPNFNYYYDGVLQGTYSLATQFDLTQPSKAGYTAEGINTKPSLTGDDVTSIPQWSSGYKYFYLRYYPIVYSVIWQGTSGATNPNASITYYNIEMSFEIQSASKFGYTFVRWQISKNEGLTWTNFIGSVWNPNLNQTGDVSFRPQFTLIDYTITYVLDGGEEDQENPTEFTILTPTITLYVPFKPGYTFDGWFTAQTGGTQVTTIDTANGGNRTLFARWTIVEYTITYENTFGAVNTNPVEYQVTDQTITLTNLSRLGYTFTGWFNAQTGGTKVTMISQGSTGNRMLYARWSIIEYNINYYFNGGSVPNDIPYTYNIESLEITLTTNTTRLGYTFGGWFKNSNLTNPITNIPAGSTGEVYAFAKWTLDTYNITYHPDGGTHSNIASYNVTTATITLNNAIKMGYTFTGWYDASTGGNKVTSIPLGSTGHKEFWARYTINTYIISYTLSSGGINHANNPSQYNVSTPTITLSNPTRVGYTFVEWRNTNVSGIKVTNIPQGTTGNKTLFAVWTPVNYSITYTPKGDIPPAGSISHDNNANYNIESPNLTLKPASAEGYVFGGWYTNQTLSEASKITTLVLNGQTGNKTIYSKWTIKSGVINLINKYVKTDLSDHTDTIVSSVVFTYGQAISINFSSEVSRLTKTKGSYWNYKFIGWTKNLASTTNDAYETADISGVSSPFTNGTMDADLTKQGNYYAVYKRERKGLRKGAGNIKKIMSGTKNVVKIYKGTQVIYEKVFEN